MVNVKRFNVLWCPQSDPHSWYNVRKVSSMVKTTGFVHNLIIVDNCWIHDLRSKMCASILWPCKKVKKMTRSKQQVLCTTSSSQLTVEPWLKVKIKRFNELRGPRKSVWEAQTDARMDRHTDVWSELPGPYRPTPGGQKSQSTWFGDIIFQFV